MFSAPYGVLLCLNITRTQRIQRYLDANIKRLNSFSYFITHRISKIYNQKKHFLSFLDFFNKKGKKMSNYKYVKRYEQTQQERGLTRQRAWIPNTETAKKALLKYATALREDFLDNQERDNA